MISSLPVTLDEAITSAISATQRALDDGQRRIQVELVVPEIALQAQAIALEFSQLFRDEGIGLRFLFPDTGAAALARRDWGDVPFQVSDLGSRNTPVEYKIAESDTAFIVVSPSAVEVQTVETLCNLAGDRPVILLIPQLEDVAIVGIGYAARQLRERFLSILFTAYYFRPLEDALVLRNYPSPWQVYLAAEAPTTNVDAAEDSSSVTYQLLAELPEKPVGEALERLLIEATSPSEDSNESKASTPVSAPKRGNFFAGVSRFLKALSQ